MKSSLSDIYSTQEKLKYFSYWGLEHLFGPRNSQLGFFGRKKENLAHLFQKRLIEKRPKFKIRPLETYTNISDQDFIENFLLPGKPVIIKGAAKNWPAVGKWSPRWFAENYPESKQPFADPKNKGYGARILTFREIADEIEAGSDHYLKFSNFLHVTPGAENDLDLSLIQKWKVVKNIPSSRQLFMGGKGTHSVIHAALAHVFFVQIYGTKRWLIVPEEWAPIINPQIDRQPHFLGQEELLVKPDEGDHPIFSRFEFKEVILEPGDFYFNPAFCWHYVENVTTSIGIGFRWVPMRAIFKSPLLSSIILMSQYPASFLRAYQNAKGDFFPRRYP